MRSSLGWDGRAGRSARWLMLIALVVAVTTTVSHSERAVAGTRTPTATPRITHVFEIVLENSEEPTSFPGTGTELDKLAARGVFIPGFYGTGHASLDNYVAMISGQAQYTSTSQDCPFYRDASGTVDSHGFY